MCDKECRDQMPQRSDICALHLQGAEEGLQAPASRPVGEPCVDLVPTKAAVSSSCGGLPPHSLPRRESGCCRRHCGLIGHMLMAEMQPHSCRTHGGHSDDPTHLALLGLNMGFSHIQEDTSDYKTPLVPCRASLFPPTTLRPRVSYTSRHLQ